MNSLPRMNDLENDVLCYLGNKASVDLICIILGWCHKYMLGIDEIAFVMNLIHIQSTV